MVTRTSICSSRQRQQQADDLYQATAMRSSRLKQLAQRQQQTQLPQPTSAPARRTSRQQVRLSAVLQQAPHLYDRQRLSAVERFIDRIDALPARYTEAQVVFLSKNSLTSVAGLEQFRQLRVLGLADNLLADPEQLEMLASACPGLEALSLEGNPIAYVPYYRSRVLLALPGLKSLDGRPITEEERAGAPAAVAAEEATMAVLLRNACEVHKMASVVQKAQLHMELLHVMHSKGAVMRRVEALGDAATATVGRSLSRLVDMWDYEALLTAEERRKIRGALLREVGRMYRQLRAQQPVASRALPTWEEAFAQVMTAQQQTTAMLLDLMTQCQLAIDELVRTMAAPLGHRTNDAPVGADGGVGMGGSEGRDSARALLLREAEADEERHRAMRREREEVLAEFRDTALKHLRGSPVRPALRSVLKSSLKRTMQPPPKHGYEGDAESGSDNDGRHSPSHSAPPKWQSARSSPPAPEAVERLMRARRGIAPARVTASSFGSGPNARRQDQAAAQAAKNLAAPQPQQQQQQPSGRPSGVMASTDATSTSARTVGRPMSAEPVPMRHRAQQQRGGSVELASTAKAHATAGGGSGSAAGLSASSGHRRAKSVDAATLTGRSVVGDGGRTSSASSSRALLRQRRRSAPGSPNKARLFPGGYPAQCRRGTRDVIQSTAALRDGNCLLHFASHCVAGVALVLGWKSHSCPKFWQCYVMQDMVSPSSPLERPVWRPAGGKPDSGRSPTSPADFKDAAHAVERAMRELRARTQEVAGTSPERIRELAAATAAVAAATAAAGMEGAASGSPTSRSILPNRGITTSPMILGRRHHHAAAANAAPMPPYFAAVGRLPDQDVNQPAHQARRSLQDALLGTATSRPAPLHPANSMEGYGIHAPRSPRSRLRASSPGPPGLHGRVVGTSAPPVAASARIDDLKREVEESAHETARLRQIAAMASMPLPQKLGLGEDPASASAWPAQAPPWLAAPTADLAPVNGASQGGAGGRFPPDFMPPLSSHYPGQSPGPEYFWQGHSTSPAGPSAPWYPLGASWSGTAGHGLTQSPHEDLTLRPREWNTAAQNEQAASPLPQPQMPPPSLQPHRGSWSGPGPVGSMPTPYALSRTAGIEGSGAGFVDLYPAALRPVDQGQAPPPHQRQPQTMSALWGGPPPGGTGPGGGGNVVLPHDHSQKWGPGGAGATYEASSAMPGAQHQQRYPLPQTQSRDDGRWGSDGSLPQVGLPTTSPASAWPAAGGGGAAMGPLQQAQQLPQDSGHGFQGRQSVGHQAGASGTLEQPHVPRQQPTAQHRGPMQLRLQPPSFPAGPGTAPLLHGAALQGYQSPPRPPPPAPFQPQLQQPHRGLSSSSRYLDDALPPQDSRVPTWPHDAAYGTADQLANRSGLFPSPQLSEAYAAASAPPAPDGLGLQTFGRSEQVTLGDFNLMRASVDAVAPGSMQPSATGTPSYSQQADNVTRGFPFQPFASSADGVHSEQPSGVVDTPWLQGPPLLQPLQSGTIGTVATAAPSVTTVVSVVDEGPSGGGGGGGGSTRVDVQEVLGEDSTGSKDQHIHLHIHPPPVQLFLQSAPELRRSATHPVITSIPAPPPTDGIAPASSISLLVQPGSPLHEALSVGNLVYERIERIKPAGRPGSPDTLRETRSAVTGPMGVTFASLDDERDGRPSRKGGYGRSAKAGPSAGSRSNQGKRTRNAMPTHSQDAVSDGEDDGLNDTELTRDDGDDEHLRDDRYHDSDSASDDRPGADNNRGARATGRGPRPSGRQGPGDNKHRGNQENRSPDAMGRGGSLSAKVLQRQYASLERQLAEQTAINAALTGQLQQLQSLVPPAVLPQHALQQEAPRQAENANPQHDDGYGLQTDSWTSSSPRVAVPGAVGRSSDTDGSGIGSASGGVTNSPTRLRPLISSVGLSPLGTPHQGPTSPGRGSRVSPRLPVCISPVAAAGSGSSPREDDSMHSTLLLLPEGATQGSSRPTARDPDRLSPRPPGQSPRAAGRLQPIEEQLLRNRAIQEQITRLGEQLAGTAASAASLELPPELAATLAGLATSSSPLPSGSLRALEQQLVAMTLEKEAVERLLVQEQAEVRMLQQELGVMAQVTAALEDTQAQLQEARLAVAHQQQELQERDQQLAASRQREVQLMEELAAEQKRVASQVVAIASYFEQQFEETRAAIVAELQDQVMAMPAGRGGFQLSSVSQPRYSLQAYTDSQPEYIRTDIKSPMPDLCSELPSQLSQGDTLSVSQTAQALDEQLSSRTASGGRTDLGSQLAGSLSAHLLGTRRSVQHSDDAAAPTDNLAPDAAFATLPEALRLELEAQVASARASLASQVAEALREDILHQLETRHSAPVHTSSSGHSRLQDAFEAEHAAQLAVMRADHTMQMEIMRARHAAQVEELLAERVVQPGAIREEYAAQLEHVRAEHAKQLEELHARHAAQVEELLAERAREPEALRAEHAAKVIAMRAEHSRQMEALRAEHMDQLEELMVERSRQPAALRAEHAAKLAALRAEHTGQMEALRSEHAARMEVLLAERATQPEAMRAEHASQLAALRAEHAKQMEILRSEHAKEVGVLLAERAALPEALRAEHAAQLEGIRSEHAARLGALRADHATQMETMRASHAAQLGALLAERVIQPDAFKAEHAVELAALRADHAKQMEAMRAEHGKQMEELAEERAMQQRDTLRTEHAAQLASLHAEHTKQMEAMRAELTSQIETLLAERKTVSQVLRDEHAMQLEAIRAGHASQLTAQNAEHAKQLEMLRAEHAKQMQRLLLEHAAQPEVIRAGYSTQAAALRAEHAMQMEALRAEHAAVLADKERLRAVAAAAHEQQLQELRTGHQKRVEDLAAQTRERLQRQEAEQRAAMAAVMEDHQAQLARHTRRLDELLARHKQQLDELADANRRQLEEVRRQGEKLLAEGRSAAERGGAEAAAAHEKAVAELAGRLRSAEAARASAEAARREGEAARAALQTQLDEVLTQLGKERTVGSELRGRNQALEVAEIEIRRRMQGLLAPQELGWRREMEAEKLGSRFLLRRVLGHWATNARLSRRHSHQVAVIVELRRRRVCRQALHHWRTTVLRTKVLRALLRANEVSLMRRALVSLKAQTLHHRRKARAISIAVSHWSVRQLSRCLEAWRQLHRMHARAAAYSDPAAVRAAITHHSSLALRAVLGAWHQHVYQTQMPKTQRRRRAAHVYRRRLLRKAMACFAQQAERRALKCSQLARSTRRHRFSVLNRAFSCWMRYLDSTRRKRSLLSMADLQYGHAVVQRWRRAAARRRALRLGLAALQASGGIRRLRTFWGRWRAFILRRRQAVLALRLASEHHRGALMWRCVSAWLHLAKQSAARQLHIKGMREYQRMMQAALRWQRLVATGRRQQAVVDRAVRMYRHRVLAATQRAVLRHWRAAVDDRRGLLRSAAVSFVHAYLSIWRRKVLIAWHLVASRAAGERGIEEALELRRALERNEGAMRQVSARLEAVGAESAELLEQLKEAQSEVLVLRQQLSESEKRLGEAMEALATAERELEAQGAGLATRADKIASLEAERDMLLDRVNTLRQQVSSGEVSVASLQEQASSLQRTLAAAQGTVKELNLKMQQQAAHYEEQLLAARDEASLARREAGSLAATASRLEQQATDSEAQLRAMRTGHEALVASLRQELRARDVHIMALNQQQQQHRDAAALSRPATSVARPPNAVFSPRPLGADPRSRSGGGGFASARGAEREHHPRRSSAGGHDVGYLGHMGVGHMGVGGVDAAAVVAEESSLLDGWEMARDGGGRQRPLFEPSMLCPSTTAAGGTSARHESRPWSSAGERTSRRAASAAGALLRNTSLLHARPPAAPPVALPQHPTSAAMAAEGVWSDSPRFAIASEALAGAAAAECSAAAVAAEAAAIEPSAPVLAAQHSVQLPAESSALEWPQPQGSHPAGAIRAEYHDDGNGDELPPPGQHRGASGAFRRLQAAEAALLATEEEFQRRRSQILNLGPATLAADAATASSGVGGCLQSQRSLSPRLPSGSQDRVTADGHGSGRVLGPSQLRAPHRSVPGTSEANGRGREEWPGEAEDAAAGHPGAGRSLRHSTSDLPDRPGGSLQGIGERLATLPLRQGAAWERELQPQHAPVPPMRRHTSTDPGVVNAGSGSTPAGAAAGDNDGGVLQAQLQQQVDLNNLTAGIVGTLSNLREALRSQSRAPTPPPLPLPPPQRAAQQLAPSLGTATAQAGSGGGCAAAAAAGLSTAGAVAASAAPRTAAAHQATITAPSLHSSAAGSVAASEAGMRSCAASGNGSVAGDDEIEMTLRDLLRAAVPLPPPLQATTARQLQQQASQQHEVAPSMAPQQHQQQQQVLPTEGASGDTARVTDAAELLSRSLASLLSAAADAAAASGSNSGGCAAPSLDSRTSGASSLLTWLPASAPGEGDLDLGPYAQPAALRSNAAAVVVPTRGRGGGSFAEPPAAALASGMLPVLQRVVAAPERGHELYTRIGSHVASVLEELTGPASGGKSSSSAPAGVPLVLTSLRKVVGMVPEEDGCSTFHADAY
ncbi:hypothetical protein VOLCADRAFT_98490 [Volvox carteri f. nagariensis]|uniref:Uncharacterized protein n=1 Tax=Volvox carteri f. nagariensis TaxID=3068 RepID=D8UFH0_VOLCA|nr:uncharacterized protein VOLCADRAFT_98490 [Volvox carteri f. nagariensis]EFJ41501.1 hypothetical protein VOLCADRAFT_98490 [Volvox carteri f. nagariensis]|eukprot:XP_002957446.1 hypothetical protein VOLCADRAFT_98490 [Volvox carteri f. nagariensis]